MYAVAMGVYAGNNSEHEKTIIINASGVPVQSDGANKCFIRPVAQISNPAPAGWYPLYYNETTFEVGYSKTGP